MIVTVDDFEHDNFIIGLGDHQKHFVKTKSARSFKKERRKEQNQHHQPSRTSRHVTRQGSDMSHGTCTTGRKIVFIGKSMLLKSTNHMHDSTDYSSGSDKDRNVHYLGYCGSASSCSAHWRSQASPGSYCSVPA
jgi:hypothetical protein